MSENNGRLRRLSEEEFGGLNRRANYDIIIGYPLRIKGASGANEWFRLNYYTVVRKGRVIKEDVREEIEFYFPKGRVFRWRR